MIGVTREPVPDSQRFPFDIEFQKSLLRLLTEDESFGHAASKHLRPEHFSHEILGWAYGLIQSHTETYNTVPSLQVILQMTRELDVAIRPMYSAMVDQIRSANLRDSAWLRDCVLDFVRRNIFVRAFHEGRELYNAGKTVQAYDHMQERMDEIIKTTWEPIDRSWFYSELVRRQSMRRQRDLEGDAIPTGFGWLDHILGGGLHLGELGVWMAYPKVGKTTMLVTLGVSATKLGFNVLHIILEGSRRLIENRYDSAFLNEVYANVKRGEIDIRKYQTALKEYQLLSDTLVLRSFVDRWDFNILDIDQELRDLERNHGWRPHLIIIDYADLMTGREKKYYRTETESQRAAYRDVKRLTNRDYGVWTACQSTRPKKGAFEKPHILKSDSASDTYEKVRCCDFWGSLNQTTQEKMDKVMRVYFEMYRDNEAGQEITIGCDLDRMQMWQHPNAMPNQPTIGYDDEQTTAF